MVVGEKGGDEDTVSEAEAAADGLGGTAPVGVVEPEADAVRVAVAAATKPLPGDSAQLSAPPPGLSHNKT
jgi:hypothetical protein